MERPKKPATPVGEMNAEQDYKLWKACFEYVEEHGCNFCGGRTSECVYALQLSVLSDQDVPCGA